MTDNLRLTKREESGIEPITESSLSGHLSNQSETEDPEKQTDASDGSQNLAEDDYQLHEALNLLKGLTILSRRG